MTIQNTFIASAVVFVMAAALPGVAHAAAPSFVGLGDLPGGVFNSRAFGVSADGSVVVGLSSAALGTEAFRWTSGGGMVGLGDLPGGIFSSNAQGVSADGSVVVGFANSASGPEAFRWTSGGGMVGLSDLPGGGFSSGAVTVSADGSVVVGGGTSASGPEAFRWTSGGGMVGLGELPGGSFQSAATGVSADGSVVVGESHSDANGPGTDVTEAFRWTSGSGMVGLDDLAGGGFHSAAIAVSADGSVAVGRGASVASGVEAFRWTSGDGMVGLGDLPGGIFESAASAVSADGSVVVGQANAGTDVFIWDQTNGMRNLRDVLVNDFGLDLTGWTLLSAGRLISNDGLTIVGDGTNPTGFTEGWIAVLPEPATLSLLALGSLFLLPRRRNRHARIGSGHYQFRDQPKPTTIQTRTSLIALAAAFVMAATLPGVANAAAPSFQGLGDLPGGTVDSSALAVSADGSVVVGNSESTSGIEAFRWTSGGGMVGLGDLSGGFFSSSANDVSSDGSVVVGSGNSAAGTEAFRWTSGGGMVGLGDLPDGAFDSIARGVSADGSVIVGRGNLSGNETAFRWTAGTGLVTIFALPGIGNARDAFGVSADGSVIVGNVVVLSSGTTEAFRWTSATGLVGLGTLPGGAIGSNGLAVSSDGSVVVGQSRSGLGDEPMRWTAGTGTVGMGNLPGGELGREALGVSADGSLIVGWAQVPSSPERTAFIWDQTNGMRKLRDVLVNDFGLGLDLVGWTLGRATGISDDGLTIVGFGNNPGGFTEAWIATVPEPATLTILALGSLTLLRRRRTAFA